MYGVGDARRALAKPRERRVPAGFVPCDQDNPGAHFRQCYRGDLANSGRAARDNNSFPSHDALALYRPMLAQLPYALRGRISQRGICRHRVEPPLSGLLMRRGANDLNEGEKGKKVKVRQVSSLSSRRPERRGRKVERNAIPARNRRYPPPSEQRGAPQDGPYPVRSSPLNEFRCPCRFAAHRCTRDCVSLCPLLAAPFQTSAERCRSSRRAVTCKKRAVC